jgi:hypothetical protein
VAALSPTRFVCPIRFVLYQHTLIASSQACLAILIVTGGAVCLAATRRTLTPTIIPPSTSGSGDSLPPQSPRLLRTSYLASQLRAFCSTRLDRETAATLSASSTPSMPPFSSSNPHRVATAAATRCCCYCPGLTPICTFIMDRMTPRFRRRTQPADASTSPTPVVTGLPPKPAVPFRGGNPQASVRQPQSASPSVSSSLSSSSSGHIMSHPSTIPAPAGASLIPAPSLPKSLRTRRLYSAKRARSPQLSLAMPPPVAVVHREPSVALAEGGVALISPPPAAVLSGSRTGIDRNDEAVASKDGSGNSRQVSPVANTPPLSSGKSSVKQRCVPAFLSPSTKCEV